MDGMDTEINYDEYRNEKFERAKEYQDYICKYLAQNYGLVISIYSSEKYQKILGESVQGFEIKFDMRRKETGNIYIELGEKAKPRLGEYYPSGIYANDNSWIYCIGDYEVLYLFSKKQLRTICDRKLYLKYIHDNSTKTSEGYLLNTEQAEKFCILKINFNG